MTHSIERLFGYEILYLAYYGNNQFEWVSDPCDSYVLKYDDDQLDEAAADIAAHGGSLCSFPFRGTLLKWVETHPFLVIPEDIKAMKAENDAALVEHRKAMLAAELAAISNAGAA